jgi:hypothetical protein
MARPKTVIDWNKVDKYLQAQCDGVGIAGLLGISPDTLYRACQEIHKIGFAEYSAQKKAEGKELLKAKQFSVAMEGDKTMLVWLGKQYLQQRDKQELTGKDGEKLIPSIQIEIINSATQVKKDDSGS